MPVALVNTSSAQKFSGSSSTSIATPASSLTAGNLSVVVLRLGSSVTSGDIGVSVLISDTAGNTYHFDGLASQGRFAMWSKANCLGHASNVVTIIYPSRQFTSITALQFSGAPSAVLADFASAGAASGHVVSCLPSSTHSDQIVVTAADVAASGHGTIAPTATFTHVYASSYDGGSPGVGSHDVWYNLNTTQLFDGTVTVSATFADTTHLKSIVVAIYRLDDTPASTSEDEATFEDGQVSHPLTFANWHHDDAVHNFAEVDLNDRDGYYHGYKPPNVFEWKPFSRGLSDKTGQMEHQSFGFTASDLGREIRGLLAADTTRFFPNRPMVAYQIDDEQRRVEGVPRMAANGFISRYSPEADLRFGFECVGWLRKKFTRQRKSQAAWQPTFKVEDFDPNITPKNVLNRPAPVLYGRNQGLGLAVYDEQTVADSARTTGYLPDPTGPSGTVHGTPPTTTTWRYYLTGMNGFYGDPQLQPWSDQRGETLAVVLDVVGSPDDAALRDQANGGVANFWNEVTVSCPDAAAVRVYRGNPDGTGIKALGYADDLGSGSFSFLDGKYSSTGDAAYVQGTDAKPPIRNHTYIPGTLSAGNVTTDTGCGGVLGTYTGLQLISGVLYAEFTFAAHACAAAAQVYQAGVRRSAAELSANFLVPNSTEWNAVLPHPHYVTKNSQRYFPIYVNSQYATAVGLITSDRLAQGDTPLTANIDGIEDVGDGTGSLITNLFLQCLHFAENALAPDRPFNSQDWVGTSPLEFTAIPGLTYVDRVSFQALADAYMDFDGTAGAIGAFLEDVGAMDALARFCLSGDFQVGENRKGQLIASREPIDIPTDVIALDDVINIVERGFAIADGVQSEFFNILPYRYGRDLSGRQSGGIVFAHGLRLVLPESDGWQSTLDGVTDVQDSASQFNFDQVIAAPQMDLYFISSAAVALTVANRVLNRYSFPLRRVQLTIPLSGTSIDLGDVFTVTHLEGIGPSGWTNESLRCLRHTLDANLNLVTIDAYALLPNGNRILAPETGAFVTTVDGTSWLTVP